MSGAWLLDRLLTAPCVVHLRSEGPPDDYGAPVITETLIDTRCYVEQAGASERTAEPQWTTQDYRLVLRTGDGASLDGWDRVDVAGMTLEVTGGPWPVRDPHNNAVHHVEVRARRAEANTDTVAVAGG